MIALLKYGTGTPFHRAEVLETNLEIPLPASTRWEIVAAQVERAGPVFCELVQQAAQNDVLHNDGTTIKILELMGQGKRRAALAEGAAVSAAVDESSETVALAQEGEHRDTSLVDGRAAKTSRAERTGTFTSDLVSTREERRIPLFFSAGHQHTGENLKELLAHRGSGWSRADSRCAILSRAICLASCGRFWPTSSSWPAKIG